MPNLPNTFALLEADEADYRTSGAAILPVPFERTTSYGKGTGAGPVAILQASQALELWDEELNSEPFAQGIATLPAFSPESFDLADALAEIEAEAFRHLTNGKFLVTIGGEHSLTQAPARATRQAAGEEIGIVQFDAHADLREAYDGTPYSHASVMRRLVDDGFPSLAVGLRSLSTPEAALIEERQLPVLWGHELEASDRALKRFTDLLDTLPEAVYLTFDVDFLDPSLMPSTGTPEPGGGTWYPTLALLRRLFERKRVLAMDVVELAPIGGFHAPDFLAAKLIYKCLGYLQLREAGRR
ncbi:MAG: agmatinase [Acidobacteriota bacterium]